MKEVRGQTAALSDRSRVLGTVRNSTMFNVENTSCNSTLNIPQLVPKPRD